MVRSSARSSVQYACTLAALIVVGGPQASFGQPAQAPAAPAVPLPGDIVAQPVGGAVPAPRKETPEKQIEMDLRRFVFIVNEGFAFSAFPYIADARFGFFGASEWQLWWLKTINRHYSISSIRIDKLEADAATVTVEYTLEPPGKKPADPKLQTETLHLRRRVANDANFPALVGGLWTIVTPERIEDAPWYSLARTALCLKQPKTFDPTSDIALSHLKQLGLGALQFSQDYEQRFAFDGARAREALTPYLPNAEPFFVPGTQIPFTFNERLSEAHLNAITEFARTVLFYDGQNEQPHFHYNGKAAILYADGHAKLVTPEEAKLLKWQP